MLKLIKGLTSHKLSIQLAYLVMVVTALVLTSFGWYRYQNQSLMLEKELNTDLEATMKILSTSITIPVFSYDIHTVEAICRAMLDKKEINYIRIDNVIDTGLTFFKKDNNIIEKTDNTITKTNDIIRKTTILYKGQSIGTLTVGATRKYLENALKKTKKVILYQFLILEVLLVIPLVLLLRFRFIQPLERLTRMTSKFGEGDLDQEIVGYRDDELGKLAKTFVTMRDSIREKIKELNKEVIEHKRAEDDLRSLRNYLSNIIDSMPSVLIGVDIDGKVTQWNKTAEKNTGIKASEAQGKTLISVFPEMASQMNRLKESIQTRQAQHELKKTRMSQSGLCYEDITIYPLITNGVNGAIIRVDDVTNSVRMEEMMIQSEKMLSVGGLAAGMAHEINNPLAGMMQTANVMSERLTNTDVPANIRVAEEVGVKIEDIHAFMEKRGILRMIQTINDSGCRVAEIVDNMLSFARKGDDSSSSCDPVELFDKVLELASTDYDLKKQYDFKTIEIIKEFQPDLPLLNCEGAKIQQVLLNILRNGAQAMQANNENHNGKKPRFILRLNHDKKNQVLRIEIEDNGPGMEEAVRKRVFEPFFTTKQVGIGTGLGLSVSYFIITENHNGTMDVVSEPGQGTTFIISLPVRT